MTVKKRIILIIAGVCLLLLLAPTALSQLLRLSHVQNFIVHRVISMVNKRIQGKIVLERIGITMPGSIDLAGVLLTDSSNDTIFAASRLSLKMELAGLITGKVHVRYASLSDCIANVRRGENDRLFNVRSILPAHDESSAAKKSKKPDGTKKISLRVRRVNLKNVRFLFDDRRSGVRVEARVGRLAVSMNRLSLESLLFNVDKLEADSSYCAVRLFGKKSPAGKEKMIRRLPRIAVASLALRNSHFVFEDTVACNSISAKAGGIDVAKGIADVNAGEISVGSAGVRGAAVSLALTAGKARPKVARENKHRWRISAGGVEVSESLFDFDMLSAPRRAGGFDPLHMHLRDIAVQAADAFYAARAIRAKVTHAAVRDGAAVALRKFTVNFSMDTNGTSAQNLCVTTASSDIRAAGRTGFSPFAEQKYPLPDLPMNISIEPSVVSTGEIGAFFFSLAGTPPFKGEDKKIRFSGNIGGKVNSLKGERLRVSFGTSTDLQADVRINGLPETGNLTFDIPALTLRTGANDIESLMGKEILPRGVSIPSQVRINAAFKGSRRAFQSSLRAESDNGSVACRLELDNTGRYTGALSMSDLNPGLIYRKAGVIGKTTLSAAFDGRGFDPKTLSASVSIDAPSIRIKNYTCRNCKLDARIDGQRYQGTLSLQDENLFLDLNAAVQAAKGREEVHCVLEVKNADFAKLRLLEDSMRISGRLEADLTGRNLNTVSGRVTLADIALHKNGEECHLDSLLGSIATSGQNQTFRIRSAALDADYSGAVSAMNAFHALKKEIAGALPVGQLGPDTTSAPLLHDFSLAVHLYNHPLFSGFLLPELNACEGAAIGISGSEKEQRVRIDAGVQYAGYGGMTFFDVRAAADAKAGALTYACSAARIGNEQAAVRNVEARGVSRRNQAALTISAMEKPHDTTLYASLSAKTSDSGITLALDPGRFYLGGYPWTVNSGNYAVLKKKGFIIHDLSLSRNSGRITVSSTEALDGGSISVGIRDFALEFLSRMLHGDTALVKGILNADVAMRGKGERFALDAVVDIRDMAVRNVALGSFSLKTHNPEGRYLLSAALKGNGNDVVIQGSIAAGGIKPEFDIRARIKSLTAQTIEQFMRGSISESRGHLSGSLAGTGTLFRPLINGTVVFRDVSVKPAALNSTIRLGNETIAVKNSVFYLNKFSIYDRRNHRARVSGAIAMDSIARFRFDVKADAENFLLLNTTKRDNPYVYGRLIADWKATIRGTSESPVIDSRVEIKAPSDLTIAVPETRAPIDRGKNVVVFAVSERSPAAIKYPVERRKTARSFRGIELNAELEAGRGVALRIFPDPSMRDSLAVRGAAALHLGIDKSGTISLTGSYDLSEGSYTVTLPPLISRKFTISPGSTIMWNGGPADATASISARYTVNAPPIDLVQNQTSKENRNALRKPLRFETILNLKGPVLKPAISFALNLAPKDKGAFGGMIDAKLSRINQDPTSLNKQVFALLVLGKFLPDDPLDQSGSNTQLASATMSSVGSFLTGQLNQWGAAILPGVQLNIGLQSYSDSISGRAVGKTLLDLGVRKQLFNDRLSVEAGGAFDIQGEKGDQNAARDIGGNVAVEYALTEDGRYSIRGYRATQYQGALEGQITETGVGVVYSRSFNFWRQLFARSKKDSKNDND